MRKINHTIPKKCKECGTMFEPKVYRNGIARPIGEKSKLWKKDSFVIKVVVLLLLVGVRKKHLVNIGKILMLDLIRARSYQKN